MQLELDYIVQQIQESTTVQSLTKRLAKILDENYPKANLENFVKEILHLAEEEHMK